MEKRDRPANSSLRWLPILSPILIALAVHVAAFRAHSASMPVASPQYIERAAQTASYRINVRIGSKVTMAMSTMTMVDQGRPVNRHLEVHIFDRRSGANLKDIVPLVTITDQKTRASRRLSNVEACLTSRHLETEPHFGDNLYLPDGTYTVTVRVAQETAFFADVAVK